MTDAVVEIDNVTKTFDDLIAVDSVSLRIERGQTLGLIGPNGAGKTTLLRMICTVDSNLKRNFWLFVERFEG